MSYLYLHAPERAYLHLHLTHSVTPSPIPPPTSIPTRGRAASIAARAIFKKTIASKFVLLLQAQVNGGAYDRSSYPSQAHSFAPLCR